MHLEVSLPTSNQSFYQVRGPPGSGKTTLMELLHRYIRDHNPGVFIRVNRSWPPPGQPVGSSTEDHFKAIDPEYSYFGRRSRARAFLLMDDAQDSFGDGYLWNQILKYIADNESRYRVVVFCSYGSTSSPGESSPGEHLQI